MRSVSVEGLQNSELVEAKRLVEFVEKKDCHWKGFTTLHDLQRMANFFTNPPKSNVLKDGEDQEAAQTGAFTAHVKKLQMALAAERAQSNVRGPSTNTTPQRQTKTDQFLTPSAPASCSPPPCAQRQAASQQKLDSTPQAALKMATDVFWRVLRRQNTAWTDQFKSPPQKSRRVASMAAACQYGSLSLSEAIEAESHLEEESLNMLDDHMEHAKDAHEASLAALGKELTEQHLAAAALQVGKQEELEARLEASQRIQAQASEREWDSEIMIVKRENNGEMVMAQMCESEANTLANLVDEMDAEREALMYEIKAYKRQIKQMKQTRELEPKSPGTCSTTGTSEASESGSDSEEDLTFNFPEHLGLCQVESDSEEDHITRRISGASTSSVGSDYPASTGSDCGEEFAGDDARPEPLESNVTSSNPHPLEKYLPGPGDTAIVDGLGKQLMMLSGDRTHTQHNRSQQRHRRHR